MSAVKERCGKGTFPGGYNGGGGVDSRNGSDSFSGGGGTDFRIGADSLYARVCVAGGGGGNGVGWQEYGYGGGSQGGGGYRELSRGTETTGGYGGTSFDGPTAGRGSFGVGGGSLHTSYFVMGGGGGWYGGGANYGYVGGGGSGYVYTAETEGFYPSGCLLNSNNYLYYARTVAGNLTIPSPSGASEMGHEGNGFARITIVE